MDDRAQRNVRRVRGLRPEPDVAPGGFDELDD
jgi:hypothetical protein